MKSIAGGRSPRPSKEYPGPLCRRARTAYAPRHDTAIPSYLSSARRGSRPGADGRASRTRPYGHSLRPHVLRAGASPVHRGLLFADAMRCACGGSHDCGRHDALRERHFGHRRRVGGVAHVVAGTRTPGPGVHPIPNDFPCRDSSRNGCSPAPPGIRHLRGSAGADSVSLDSATSRQDGKVRESYGKEIKRTNVLDVLRSGRIERWRRRRHMRLRPSNDSVKRRDCGFAIRSRLRRRRRSWDGMPLRRASTRSSSHPPGPARRWRRFSGVWTSSRHGHRCRSMDAADGRNELASRCSTFRR